MFIDYVALLLVNMTAGFFLLAWFIYRDFAGTNRKRWVPAFAAVGLVAFVAGLHMSFTWPLPGSFNEPYGNTSVLLGIGFLGTAWALAKDWDLFAIGIYAFFSSLVPIVIGPRLIMLGMTQQPLAAGTGFVLSGIGGILTAVNYSLRTSKVLRLVTAIVLVIAGVIWAFTGYGAVWEHLGTFLKWAPLTGR
jgi:putative membrane protein